MNIVEELCQDHKKNLFIQKNKQLLRMAHIELISFQTVLRRIQSNKKVNELLSGNIVVTGSSNTISTSSGTLLLLLQVI